MKLKHTLLFLTLACLLSGCAVTVQDGYWPRYTREYRASGMILPPIIMSAPPPTYCSAPHPHDEGGFYGDCYWWAPPGYWKQVRRY